MAEQENPDQYWTYCAREAVGVFNSPESLETAVNKLELAGFDRASISVLGSDHEVKKRVGHLYLSIAEAEDDPKAPQVAFGSKDSRAEAETLAVALPFYVVGIAGAWAVIATGGALAAAFAAAILGGATAGGLGGLLAHAIGRQHTKHVQEQLAEGGIVLWISVPDKDTEQRALSVLGEAGASDVHVHEINREWGPADRPLSQARIDPWLDRDPPV
jgi:hypothetical protein